MNPGRQRTRRDLALALVLVLALLIGAGTLEGRGSGAPTASAGLAAPAQPVFEGRVYAGTPGEEPPLSTPIEGVTVSLYCSNNAPDPGMLLRSTTTNSDGWYGLEAGEVCEYYNLMETDLSGYISVGARSVDGTVMEANWIQYTYPLTGKTFTGNKFWDQAEGGSYTLYLPLILKGAWHAPQDPADMIYSVELGPEAETLRFETLSIPRDAFSEEEILPEPKEDDLEPEPPGRIHPVLQERMAQNPGQIEPVLILLQDDLQVPRFPDLPAGVRRDDPQAEPLAQVTEALIAELLAQRQVRTELFLAAAAELGVHLRVTEQFWIINGFLTQIELSQVESLLNLSQMTYIQPQLAGEIPPQDGDNQNDVDDGRFRVVSDPYFNLGLSSGYIGLLDSGLRRTHVLFNSPSNVDYMHDCVSGGTNCANSSAPGWSPNDVWWNHGTSSAAILVGNNRLGNVRRGVTAITLDSWNIYSSTTLDTAAAVRAFQRAIAAYDRVIVGEIQSSEGENGAIALAADNAYNAGAAVVAANGNCALNDACTFGTGVPRAKSVRSPAIAHKVIGVGAVDVATQAAQTYQGLGSAPDGRYKPELQGPTNSETASNASDTALQSFGGTSGSTPYAAGATALMRNWLRQHNTFENGHIYAHMMNSGTLAWPTYDNTRGLGQLRMPVNGVVWWGKVNVSQGTVINIPINISSGRRDLRVSLWWPESQTEKHDDVDLYLLDPAGVQRARSISGPSIFERAWVTGSLTPGTWIAQIRGYKVQSGPQPVYWVVDAAN